MRFNFLSSSFDHFPLRVHDAYLTIFYFRMVVLLRASLIAQLVKDPPAMPETWAQSLGWEDPLEKGMAITPVFWPGDFHGLYSSWDHKELDD